VFEVEGFVYLVGWVIFALLPLFAFVDGFRYSDEEWSAVGANKVAWLVAIALTGLLCGLIGTGLAIFYGFTNGRELSNNRKAAAG
jgi:hypothetical protein